MPPAHQARFLRLQLAPQLVVPHLTGWPQMSPLRRTCPESPSLWGRLAFPRLSPLTLGSQKVPETLVLPRPLLPPRPLQGSQWSPSVAGAVPSVSATHLPPCPLGTRGPEGEGGEQTAKRQSAHGPRCPQAPGPGGQAGSGSRPMDLASCHPWTQHLAENSVSPGPALGPFGRWSPQWWPGATSFLCGGKVIRSLQNRGIHLT